MNGRNIVIKAGEKMIGQFFMAFIKSSLSPEIVLGVRNTSTLTSDGGMPTGAVDALSRIFSTISGSTARCLNLRVLRLAASRL